MRPRPLALAGALVLLGLLIAALPGARVDHATHGRRAALVQGAQHHESARVRDVLQIRGGTFTNFDSLVAHQRALEERHHGLLVLADGAAAPDRDALVRAVDRVVTASEASGRAVEAFKSHHAIATNSALYVSRLADRLSESPGVAERLGRLQLELLRFERIGSADVRARIQARAAELASPDAAGEMDKATRARVELLRRHVELWLTHEDAVAVSVGQIVGATTEQELEALGRLFEERYASELAGAQRMRAAVTLLALLLIGALVLALVPPLRRRAPGA